MSDVVDLLAAMVRIPSVNCADRPVEGEFEGESRMAAFVHGYLSDRGIQCELQTVAPGRENVVARISGAAGGPPLVMETHMDTVAVDDMCIEPFEPRPDGERVWGRGACDAKAQLAAMMTALVRVARGGAPQDCVLVAVADEEYGHGGVRRYLKDRPQMIGAIVGEPTSLRVVVAHKGAFRPRITTRGVSAHSSNPASGVSAIYRMAHVIRALETYADDLAAREPHPLVGGPTLSVGTVRGGTAVNVVPDFCEAMVDRRLIPGETEEGAREEIRAWLAERLAADVEYEMLTTLADSPVETSPDQPVVKRAQQAARSIHGDDGIYGVPYGSDASDFRDAGVPVVVCGPGDIAQCHTADEWVAIEQVEMAADLYEAFLLG